ncbi:MAG TPA: galactokinase [Candidatus Dormibacteraeota bacterium]|nr:galactokinase [Candidatus Dormibacteraeota bacterium]
MANEFAEIQKFFYQQFQGEPRIYRAPGRVNLIGEHTDYNDGFVMPAAIDFYVWVAISPRPDRKLIVHSVNFSETVEIDLLNEDPKPKKHWSDYVQGVVLMLQRANHAIRGADIVIRGDVPIGSGLSSSAAIEVSTGFALLDIAGLTIDRVELAKLCRRAENEFVGAQVGIMDQFISACGHKGRALMLDCRSLEFKLLPVPSSVSLVICNTMIRHELSKGEYNTRRKECGEAVRLLSGVLPGIRALRDVTPQDLQRHCAILPPVILKRVRHVVSEDARVQDAAAALQRQDLSTFGNLMGESHRSLRDDYQVSCRELDIAVELAAGVPGVYGARMTGGGFGGCTINLVASQSVQDFKRHVSEGYERKTGISPQIFVSSAAEGVGEVKRA